MEQPLAINEGVVIPGFELWYTASRSGGPGGQHVNKTSSRVTLHWNITGTVAFPAPQKELLMRRLHRRINAMGVLTLSVDDSRSQHKNRGEARDRLVELIKSAMKVAKRRVPTKISAGAKRRRLMDKRRKAEQKSLRKTPPRDD